jgi:hypothetical protein
MVARHKSAGARRLEIQIWVMKEIVDSVAGARIRTILAGIFPK